MEFDKIDRFYSNVRLPDSYSSIDKLIRNTGLKRTQVKKYLEGKESYTLHRQARKRFTRNIYSVNNIDDLWEMDLADVGNIARYNRGYKYLFMIIDSFSKYLWIVPLKNKTSASIIDGMNKVLKESKRHPLVCQSDLGREFKNKAFQNFLKARKIEFRFTNDDVIKASLVERVIRTIKTKLYRMFTENKSYNYTKHLPDIVHSYNSSIHSATGKAPNKTTNRDVLSIWRRMQRRRFKLPRGRVLFKEGDSVRISKKTNVFNKGYEGSFSNEVFTIHKVIPRIPQPVYMLRDANNEIIIGKFYNFELIKTSSSGS